MCSSTSIMFTVFRSLCGRSLLIVTAVLVFQESAFPAGATLASDFFLNVVLNVQFIFCSSQLVHFTSENKQNKIKVQSKIQ